MCIGGEFHFADQFVVGPLFGPPFLDLHRGWTSIPADEFFPHDFHKNLNVY
jgi:hypothetical protein